MKKVLLALLLCSVFAACSSNETSINENDELILQIIESETRNEDKGDTSNPNNNGGCNDPANPLCNS